MASVHRRVISTLATVVAVVVAAQSEIWAQGFNQNNGAVGGIAVSPEGVVKSSQLDAKAALRSAMLKEIKQADQALQRTAELRMVSLRGLERAIADARKNNPPKLPDEVRFLGGLQRIEHVLVYPERGDIVLAGPGEGWKVDENANVVGVTSGLPVIQLDDLLVAFRTVRAAREGGLSCSIDPTAEGRVALDRYLAKVRQFSPEVTKGMQDALGAQRITLNGVPGDSHFARVLVAADYHMKRIAMNLDRSPVASLPGFLDMLRAKRTKLDNLMPRWWLACHYEPLLRSEDRLAWQIKGPGVKAMTEDDFINQDGTVQNTGKKNPTAAAWANLMTTHYQDLAKANTVFGELRNIMDLCVIAALIEQEQLLAKAGLSLPLITQPNSDWATQSWSVPKTVSTQCSLLNTGREFIVTASGGVQIESWQVAQNSVVSSTPTAIRAKVAAPSGESWWWH